MFEDDYELLFEVHDYIVYHNTFAHLIFRKKDGKTFEFENDDPWLNAVVPEHLMPPKLVTYCGTALEMNEAIEKGIKAEIASRVDDE